MFKTLLTAIKNEIERELALADSLKKKRTSLSKYANTRLTCKTTANGKFYSTHEKSNGKSIRKYVGRKNQLVADIQSLRFVDITLGRVDINLKALTGLLNVLQSPDALDVINALPQVYRDFDTSKLQAIDSKTQELYDDMLARQKAAPHPNTQNLRHRVTSELTVRSKSEALIATELINRNALFLYEAPLQLNGETVYPDFMIFHKGRIFIIEHLGLLANEKYFRNYFNRLLDLSAAGFNIGTQLFITCDDPDGNINMPLVRAIIDVILAS